MEEEIIKKEELQNELKFKQINNNNKIDLYPYQCLLFLFTQFGYLAVVPSMLLTTFFEPNLEFCQNGKDKNFQNSAEERLFHSLLIEWKEHCKNSIWTVLISSIVLLGTIIGSFVAGFVADRFGRKPVVVVSMFSICFFNFLLCLFGGFNKIFALFVLFFIGTACGGYMVTNMVLLVEVLRNPTARLLVVSLNGWPFGMIGTAFLAFFLPNWKLYSLAISIFALLFSVIIQYFACESIPWLIQSGKQQKAHFAQQHLIRINSFLALTKKEEINETYDLFMPNNENTNFENSIEGINEAIKEEEKEDLSVVVYTYFDLFRFSSIRVHLLSLLFCFGSSSIVSFGLYFSAELLPGSRYLNIALMGFCKLTFGFIPFIASNFMGRKPILLISIGFAMFSAWSLVICHLFNFDKYFVITIFGLLMTGAIDPNWKIIHLLSIELFPTPIRNMARALCNAFSRLGSLLGPWFLLTKVGNNQFFPFFVFSILLTIQFFICLIFLPETKGKPLPNSLIKYSSNKNNLNRN